jgi:hypothetical protein
MKAINQKKQLATKIALLRSKQATDFLILKDQYHITIDSFKPINLIKNSLEDAITSPGLKMGLITGAIGLSTNFLKHTVLNHGSKNPVKRILGNVLQFALKNFIERTR